MLNVEEYSEFLQLRTQFQDSIYAQPTVSNEFNNQRVVNRAKDIHRQNQKTIWNTEKGMGERVFNLMDDMGRSINQCVDDLQVSIGIKRGLSDNSDFDSSDEENESPTKKQRVESPAPN